MKKNTFYKLFFIILLMTEFYYIEIGGGIARPYHFMAILVVFSLVKRLPQLFKSPVFLTLLVFTAINLIAAALSDRPADAFTSLLIFFANFGVSIATALILLTGKVNITSFKRIVLTVTLISIAWGLIQIVGGASFAFSAEQELQIIQGFGPGFRTEANTFGKYMLFPFLLFFPDYIESYRTKKMNWTYLIFLIGMLMNFTRSSIYGLFITFVFIAIWYVKTGKLSLLMGRISKIFMVVGVGVFLMISGAISTSEYAKFKIEHLFDEEEITEGGSSSYRIESMQSIIDIVLSDTKKMIIGNGWGQTYTYLQGRETQAGGADFVVVLGYCGVIGVLTYLAYTLIAYIVVKNVASSRHDSEKSRFAEGVMFAIIGIFSTGQIVGGLIFPEYWMLIGLCIYLSVKERNHQPRMQFYREGE